MFKSYHFFTVISIVAAAYGVSLFLARSGRIDSLKHKRFWNWVLLAVFLVSGLLGTILAFCIDYRISIGWYNRYLWVHVEAGLVMAIISAFHIIWHWRYFISAKKTETK